MNNSRIAKDVAALLSSGFDARLCDEHGGSLREVDVLLPGPPDSLYAGGSFLVHVELPQEYPYKSPSIGFRTRVFHPNIDEHSGSVCLDVINQTWSPMFSLVNVFDSFLPQLLLYPNAADPLNGAASSLFHQDKPQYEATVRACVEKYAMNRPASAAAQAAADGVALDSLAAADMDVAVSDESDVEAEIAGTLQAKRRQSSHHSGSGRFAPHSGLADASTGHHIGVADDDAAFSEEDDDSEMDL